MGLAAVMGRAEVTTRGSECVRWRSGDVMDLEDLFDYVCSILILSRAWSRCGQNRQNGI